MIRFCGPSGVLGQGFILSNVRIGRLVCWTFTESLASFRFILLRVQRIGKTRPLLPVSGLVPFFYVFFPVGSFGKRIGNSGSWCGASHYFPPHLNQLSSE